VLQVLNPKKLSSPSSATTKLLNSSLLMHASNARSRSSASGISSEYVRRPALVNCNFGGSAR
jgi:hypothetical protein